MGLRRGKRLVQCPWTMGRQIVHHYANDLRLRVMDVDQVTHAFGKIYRRALLGDLHFAPWSMSVLHDEKVHGAIATVLVVVATGLSRGSRDWLPHLANQLGRAFVE